MHTQSLFLPQTTIAVICSSCPNKWKVLGVIGAFKMGGKTSAQDKFKLDFLSLSSDELL
jgi:hypothetical protein